MGDGVSLPVPPQFGCDECILTHITLYLNQKRGKSRAKLVGSSWYLTPLLWDTPQRALDQALNVVAKRGEEVEAMREAVREAQEGRLSWRWGEPGDEACRMGGTGSYRQVTITEKEGGLERKTNLTLPSYVWVGGETAKWPNAAEGETLAAFLCLFGLSNPPPKEILFPFEGVFFVGGGVYGEGSVAEAAQGWGHPPVWWV